MAGIRYAGGGKVKTSNFILLVMGIFALAFIVAMTVIFCVKGAVPDTLIQYTLGAGGAEALLLAGIKVSKVFAGDRPGKAASITGKMEDVYESND